MGEKKQANARLTITISKQYPVTSLNGQRLAALRKYFGDDLERNMIQAMWAVLGPLGSILAELPQQDIQFHLNSSKLTIKGFRQEALDMIGGGKHVPEKLEVAGEKLPTTEDAPIQSEQSGDPLNNMF